MSGAVGHKRVLKEFIESYPIPVPPLPEQQRIVGILDEAFEGIATAKGDAEKNLENARALFESHLQSVFTQRGPGWLERPLGEICERVSVGHVDPTSQFYCDPADGIPFLRSQNVRPGKLDREGVQDITKDFHERLKKSQLRFGDLLFVRVGANRGDCCAVLEDVSELNCANIVFARPSEGNAAYLERYCQSPPGRKQLLGMTTGSEQGVMTNSTKKPNTFDPYTSKSLPRLRR
jgi:type I restriction enzyme S subunit